jgi:hypothetical protein
MFLRAGFQYDLSPEAHQQPQHGRRQGDKADSTDRHDAMRVRGSEKCPSHSHDNLGGAGRARTAAWALRDNSKGGGWRDLDIL